MVFFLHAHMCICYWLTCVPYNNQMADFPTNAQTKCRQKVLTFYSFSLLTLILLSNYTGNLLFKLSLKLNQKPNKTCCPHQNPSYTLGSRVLPTLRAAISNLLKMCDVVRTH